MDINVKLSKKLFESDNYQVVIFTTIDGCEKKSFRASGNLPKLTTKEELVVSGEFQKNQKYGEQFIIKNWKRPIPDTKEQLVRFFSSSLFPGVGKKMAERIVKELGTKAIKRIASDGLNTFKHMDWLKEEKATLISETVNRTFVLNDLIEQYNVYGITSDILMKAHMYLGQRTHELKENPYLLAHYQLIHFAFADEIGMKMGILPHARIRLETVVRIGLKEWIINQGHCYLEEETFIDKSLMILNKGKHLDEEKVHANSYIEVLEQMKETYIEQGLVYPKSIYYAEKNLAHHIHSLTLGENHYDEKSVEMTLKKFELTQVDTMASKQREVIHELIKNNVLIMTGAPGTGKTYTINALLTVYKQLFPNAKIALAAPTGRAAKKVGEVTGMGSHAQTLHRLLGIGVFGNERPLFDEGVPLPYDLVVVDEFSMADVKIASMLVAAIKKGSKLLIVGDPDQLPSVGAGNVLKDLLSARIPQIHLTEIYRQAKESTIIRNSLAINGGGSYDFSNKDDHYFIESNIPQQTANYIVASITRFMEKGYDLHEIMVLSPMKKGLTGIENLNEMIRDRVNPIAEKKKEAAYGKLLYRVGDKVMYTTNNQSLDVFNGDTGVIKDIDKKLQLIKVEIDGRLVTFEKSEWKNIQLAFVSTVHKAQGGQAKVVIMTLTEEHDLMLSRNLFLTGISRAEEIFVLIGSKVSAIKAIENDRVRSRNTRLAERLLEIRKYIEYAECN